MLGLYLITHSAVFPGFFRFTADVISKRRKQGDLWFWEQLEDI
jgi:hypothetical protein